MSDENNDERIKRLENQVAVLVEIIQFLNKMVVVWGSDHIALRRFLMGSSLPWNDKEKRQLIHPFSLLDNDFEQIEAMVAHLGKVAQSCDPEAPPPDESEPPGPAV